MKEFETVAYVDREGDCPQTIDFKDDSTREKTIEECLARNILDGWELTAMPPARIDGMGSITEYLCIF